MQAYSPYFKTLYDELSPVGNLGRGTHYSILEIPQWKDINQNSLEIPFKQKIAVIWDEDHDTRVIQLIEKAYFDGLLSPVCVVGERKGTLTILTYPDFSLTSAKNRQVFDSLNKLGDFVLEDNWYTVVDCVFNRTDSSIIQDSKPKVDLYLRNISMLWDIY